MYTPTKLTEYRSKYNVSWAKQLPDDTPPEDVVVAYDKESLFRLIQEEGVMTKNLVTNYGKHLDYLHFAHWKMPVLWQNFLS